VTVYQQLGRDGSYCRDPSDLLGPELNDQYKIRDHLLSLYIPAAVQHVGLYRKAADTPRRAHIWLAALAAYLENNEATPQTIGGRFLSGTDIVLHELWPLAGNRPRFVTFVAVAVTWLVGGAVIVIDRPGQLSWAYLGTVLAAAALAVITLIVSWARTWPKPTRINFSEGRRELRIWLVACVLVAVAILRWQTGWIFTMAVLGTVSALSTAVVALFESIMTKNVDGTTDPRGLITANLWFSLASAVTLGCTIGLITRSAGLAPGIVLACGLTMGIVFGITVGLAGARYIAMLMCARGRLPGRLSRFLRWCHRAGLLRVAGAAYQFRHRELQKYLAQHPEPSS
jgi:hypothetical protein